MLRSCRYVPNGIIHGFSESFLEFLEANGYLPSLQTFLMSRSTTIVFCDAFVGYAIQHRDLQLIDYLQKKVIVHPPFSCLTYLLVPG